MTILTMLSSRAFNQDIGRAKRAAEAGPRSSSPRGRPAFVLLRYEAYQQLAGEHPSIRQLDQPGVEDIDFHPPRMGVALINLWEVPDGSSSTPKNKNPFKPLTCKDFS
ncbi:MAG: type II toxin-antitoxin system Phd/YefM family antitoxin [Burkholderiales bacterium]